MWNLGVWLCCLQGTPLIWCLSSHLNSAIIEIHALIIMTKHWKNHTIFSSFHSLFHPFHNWPVLATNTQLIATSTHAKCFFSFPLNGFFYLPITYYFLMCHESCISGLFYFIILFYFILWWEMHFRIIESWYTFQNLLLTSHKVFS